MKKEVGSIGVAEWMDGKGIVYPVTFILPNGRPHEIYISEGGMLAAISRGNRNY